MPCLENGKEISYWNLNKLVKLIYANTSLGADFHFAETVVAHVGLSILKTYSTMGIHISKQGDGK